MAQGEPLSPRDKGKKAASEAAVADFVRDGMTLGIGSGTTIVYAVQKIAELYHKEKKLQNIVCVPTSFQASELLSEYKLPIGDLFSNFDIDVDLDGADEIDDQLNCIKGGGGCHMQEKMVAFNAKKFIVLADYTKKSDKLGTNWKKGVPVSVIPDSRVYLSDLILKQLKGKCVLRMAKAKAGPVVTDQGHLILDIDFGVMSAADISRLDHALHLMPGIVDTGFFVNMAEAAYIGNEDGTVTKLQRPKQQSNEEKNDK